MKFVKHGFQLGAIAAALTLGTSAFAATSNASGINPGTASDTTNTNASPGTVSSTNQGAGSFSVARYNGSDILTGLSFSAVSGIANNNSLSLTLGKTGNTTNETNAVTGTANLSATVTLGGNSVSATSTSASYGLTNVNRNGTSQSTTGSVSYSTGPANVSNAQLANFYGAGNAQTGTVTETISANKATGVNGTGFTANNNGNHSAVVTYTYSTQAHASGYLDSIGNDVLSLSFGQVAGGVTPANLSFNLYNTLGTYGLQVIGITQAPGSSNVFTLGGIGLGTTVAGGNSAVGTISMAAQNPSGQTNYSSTWLIQVADSSAGVGIGKDTTVGHTLTVNVTAAVPEPESYAMLLAGLGALGFMGRRRNRASKA